MTNTTLIATVDIRQRTDGALIEIEFNFPRWKNSVLLTCESLKVLESVKSAAGKALEAVAEISSDPQLSSSEALRALTVLRDRGVILIEDLAGQNGMKVKELQRSFRRALRTYKTSTWPVLEGPIPLVEIRSHGPMVPIELMPLFDLRRLPEAIEDNEDELRDIASRFLGFNAIVRRVREFSTSGDHVLVSQPHLSIQLLRHSDVGANEVDSMSRSARSKMVIHGPWPAREGDSAKEKLIESLYSGDAITKSCQCESCAVQIQHFACHCDTSSEFDTDFKLILSNTEGRKKVAHEITLDDIRIAYGQRFYDDGDQADNDYDDDYDDDLVDETDAQISDRAVIFLNACGTSVISPRTSGSFPAAFLAKGHRAFVGTESWIPDDVATQYSALFYEYLLSGSTLGEATLHARRGLMHRFLNPLGLVYATYGDLELAIPASPD